MVDDFPQEVSRLDEKRIKRLTNLFDDLHHLAGRIAFFDIVADEDMLEGVRLASQHELDPPEDGYHSHAMDRLNNEVESLTGKVMRLSDLVVTYSGRGVISVLDPFGEPYTAYGEREFHRGRLTDIFMGDVGYARDMLQDEDEEDGESADVDGDTNLMSNPNTRPASVDESDNPPGYRLIGRVLTHETDVETELNGPSVMATGVKLYDFIELDTIKIHDISTKPEAIREHNVPQALLDYSKRLNRLLKDTRFRRSTAKEQRETVDKLISEADSMIGINRFYAVMNPKYIYSIETKNENRRTQRKSSPEGSMMFVDFLRLDNLDLFRLSEGERLVNDGRMLDSKSGLYIVGSMTGFDFGGIQLGIPEERIIWIPVEALTDEKDESGVLLPRLDELKSYVE